MGKSPPLLICMMGLPRSGKSTVSKVMSKVLAAPIVNRDSIRLALHGQRYQKLAEPMVKATAIVMVRALFLSGNETIILDETSLKSSSRRFWKNDEEWDQRFFHVKTPIEVCLERARSMNDEVIQPVIKKMAEYAEPLDDQDLGWDDDGIIPKVVIDALEKAQGFPQG
jgi:tRNA uridine 5-carbamoylmethylation protein Kti12